MPRVLRAIARRLGLCTPLSPPWCGDEGAVPPSVMRPWVDSTSGLVEGPVVRVASLEVTVETIVAVHEVFVGSFLVLRSGRDLAMSVL